MRRCSQDYKRSTHELVISYGLNARYSLGFVWPGCELILRNPACMASVDVVVALAVLEVFAVLLQAADRMEAV